MVLPVLYNEITKPLLLRQKILKKCLMITSGYTNTQLFGNNDKENTKL